MNLSIREKNLAAKLLEIASEKFGNYICNDVDESIFSDWTIRQRQEFVKEFHKWNGDPEEYDENFMHIPDYALMDFMAHKLTNEIPSL